MATDPATRPRALFLAWVRFQRRPAAMQPFFGFELVCLPLPPAPGPLKLLAYGLRFVQSLVRLSRARPDVVWLQLPPAPLLGAALLHRSLARRPVRILADCHNPIFAPPWSRWPGLVRRLNDLDVVLVHNDEVVRRARALGIREERLRVLVDAPVELRPGSVPPVASRGPFLLFLTTFLRAEPIRELLAAARSCPELRFIVTGDARRARFRHDLAVRPPNVELAGYLPLPELDATLLAATAVLGLTRSPDEQLSSAAEGLAAGKALVLADSPTLRALHPLGAVFVDVADPASIARGCRRAVADAGRLALESVELRQRRAADWRRAAELLREELG